MNLAHSDDLTGSEVACPGERPVPDVASLVGTVTSAREFCVVVDEVWKLCLASLRAALVTFGQLERWAMGEAEPEKRCREARYVHQTLLERYLDCVKEENFPVQPTGGQAHWDQVQFLSIVAAVCGSKLWSATAHCESPWLYLLENRRACELGSQVLATVLDLDAYAGLHTSALPIVSYGLELSRLREEFQAARLPGIESRA